MENIPSRYKDYDLQQRLINNFVKNNLEKYKEITDVISEGDIVLAHRLAHTLKTNAGQLLSFGLIDNSSLQRIAEEIEKSLSDGENRVNSRNLDILKTELDKVLNELLPKVRDTENPESSETIDVKIMDKRNSVLLVDDDTSNLMELTHILRSEYKIHAVRDGVSALETANEYLPDLILLDILMPEMDGFEVIAKLRNSERTCSIPVVFITGVTESGNEIKGLSAGAVDYIHKPFNDMIVKLRVRQQIQIINQLRRIEQLSMIDQLTNIANRRCFENRIIEEWGKASRDKSSISILMLDIDRFKNYNDTYGHQQGDAALKAVSGIFTQALKRPGDFAARWGGEEFIILLPNTEPNGALDVAQQIRKFVENMEIPGANGLFTKVTVSIGVNTRIHGCSGSIDEFISKADIALYEAKNKGRNMVCFSA